MKNAEIAGKMLELLSAPREGAKNSWTKRVYARDGDGAEVEAESPSACRWCFLGALDKVVADWQPAEKDKDIEVGHSFLNEWDKLGVYEAGLTAEWNDARERTFEDIKRALQTIAQQPTEVLNAE